MPDATNASTPITTRARPRAARRADRRTGRIRFKTVEQGAATSVLVATSLQLQRIGGRYFEDCHEAEVLPPGSPESSTAGVMSYAVDADDAERLWDVSLSCWAGALNVTGRAATAEPSPS